MWKLIPLPILLLVWIGMCTPTIAKCGDHDDAVVALVAKCPAAVEALGSDIGMVTFGCATGRSKIGTSTGTASWSIGITGSKDSGRIDYSAAMTDGQWRVGRASLQLDKQAIDIVRCVGAEAPDPVTRTTPPSTTGSAGATSPWNATAAAEPGPSPLPTAETEPGPATPPTAVTFEGSVLTSSNARVAAGSRCTATLRRGEGATGTLVVQCGSTTIYEGSGGVTLESGRSEFDDSKPMQLDRTPIARLSSRGRGGTLSIVDAGVAVVIML